VGGWSTGLEITPRLSTIREPAVTRWQDGSVRARGEGPAEPAETPDGSGSSEAAEGAARPPGDSPGARLRAAFGSGTAAASRGGRAAGRAGRSALRARGAGESGLARVLELHLVSTFADTLIVTALASTIFFSAPIETARSRVAISLLLTMAPFVVLAPLIGPMLDRVPHGRRYAIAASMVVRAFLAWVMAGAVTGDEATFGLYPAALGFLVCQKAYLVTRAAAVPRVLPTGDGLVTANARISAAGVIAMVVAAPLGAGLTAWLGPPWTLRLAFAVFAAGTALALALPKAVDSSAGELEARLSREREPDDHPDSWSIGPAVVLALRANAALRAFTGFLTLFLAFRLRTQPLSGMSDAVAVVVVITAAAVGGALGTALGASLRRRRPEGLLILVLAGTSITAVWSAIAYGIVPVLAIALAAGLAQALGKLCLDALIQRDVPERVRTSAFARSETLIQLAWVIGGGVGLVLPVSGAWGLGLAAAGMLAMTVATVATTIRERR
jgi:MFS family permease